MSKRASPQTIAQKQFAAKKGKLAELQKAANQAALQAAKEWLAKNPDSADLKIRPMNVAYIQRKGNTAKAITELAIRMMYPSNQDRTQKQILEDIKPMFADLELYSSIWQKKLSTGLLKQVVAKVNGNLPQKDSFTGCTTLSQIRKRVKTKLQVAKGKRGFKAEITFTNESVIIGKRSYPLELRGPHYCIRVTTKSGKRCWVRMDGLAAALMNS